MSAEPMFGSADQCRETIYVRDTYRRTGRVPGGFEMHYKRQRCSRNAGPNGYCWQHERMHPQHEV